MTTVHLVKLAGCRPQPLAHYLKALGVFRLVAEQRDPRARAFFVDDVFHLASSLDEPALLSFLCDEFAPTPMVSPWNGGSGFYPKDNATALDAIVGSITPRFAGFRDAIASARALVGGRGERPADEAKDAMLASCVRGWSEPALGWVSAAVSLGRDGEAKFPALLGTGGNDGRLDFTNNLMQRLIELIDPATGLGRDGARSLARAALFGTVERGLVSAAIGQFHPGGAGGANGTAGFDAGSLFNPWDYVLALEGAILLRVAALRRLDGGGLSLAGAPFALHGVPGGYASATDADDEGRGEQWMPLWSAPATLPEVRGLFAEGRLVAGASRPRGALDAARAIAQLGVARGVVAFERYGFMVRNGLSNLAVPMRRVTARVGPNMDVRLLDEIDPWLASLRQAADSKHAPPSFARSLRAIQAVLFDLCVRPETDPRDWGRLLEELGAAEDLAARSGRFAAAQRLRPLPALSERWAKACDDGTREHRLACVLATAHGPRDLDREPLGPLRVHVLPLVAPRFEVFAASEDSLRDDPRVVWTGADLVDDVCRVVLRRALESQRAGYDGLALVAGAPARLDDLTAFVNGDVDDRRIARLARGMMSVRRPPASATSGAALPLFALFRVANCDASAASRAALERPARCDLQTLRLLDAGRLEAAGRMAITRLGAMGFRSKLRHASGDPRLARRLLASLAFPLDGPSLSAALSAVTKPLEAKATETP